jgi:cobalamin synthase
MEDTPHPSLPPTTTAQQDLTKAGQRQINLIWENTQMRVALSVIWTALLVAAILATMGKFLGSPDLQLAAVVFVFGVANLVTGFYFGRTNHQRSGGIDGDKAGDRG